jgi:hypothetical protein
VSRPTLYSRALRRVNLRSSLVGAAAFSAAWLGGTSVSYAAELTIVGIPPGTVSPPNLYYFVPKATETAPNRTLTFTIKNKPSWAIFKSVNGVLAGWPSSANAGTYSDIVISVSDGKVSASLSAFSVKVTSSGQRTSSPIDELSITGAPVTSVVAGRAYSFRPAATDSAGRTISFSVANKPDWATFSIATGLLSGTPSSAQAGKYANVTISASDGQTSSALSPFTITVTAAAASSATGSATLYWIDPATNTNGTPLTNLAGIRIYYGTSQSSLAQMVQVPGTTQTSYTIGNLTAGTWYFGATAYNTAGAESSLSTIGAKSIP